MSQSSSPCACRAVVPGDEGDRLVIRSATSHSLRVMERVAADGDVEVVRGDGLLELRGDGLHTLLLELDAALSGPEAEEARAVFLPDESPCERQLLARVLGATSLGTLAARVRYRHLADICEDESRFYSRYQPLVDLTTHRPIAYEALLRARTDGREVPAGDLFGAAAAGGWTNVLDRIGRETAIQDAAPWLGDHQLFINFVPTSIYRPEVCLATTIAAAEAHQVDVRQLVFEVVETHRTDDVAHLLSVIGHYRANGARVALDDVGSGYASLSLVAQVEPDIVKLDLELVQQLPQPTAAAICSSIIELSHGIGAEVVAEGIETEAQADAALELGADIGQGWYFGRPALSAELAASAAVQRGVAVAG